jgi:S1-C subfamily serine protease
LEGTGAPPPWAPIPPASQSASFWSRIAAYIVLIAVVAAAAGAGIGWSLARAVTPSHQSANATTPESPINAATPSIGSGNSSANAIAAKLDPAIVDINTTLGNGQAAGTGMIVSSTGEILTNNHVVAQSTRVSVTVQGRSQAYSAHVVGVDTSQDVAVIQIDQNVSGLPTATFANSSSIHVGDAVIAIGNALGQGGTPHVTSGQVTALDQTITASTGSNNAETLNGMIQSDALIYEGDSGGALVNSSGQVVGMITAGQAQGFRSAASNVGYAIASNTALGVVNRIRAHEQAADLTYGQVGYLGVAVRDADNGALVTTAVAGGPAESAGISAGSVITNIGGSAVTDSNSLGTAVHSHKPGETVSVTWVDSSGTHTATVTLGGVNP